MADKQHIVFVALGTNLGRRAANLRAALAAFPPTLRVLKASPVYETEPWGYADQPAFFNQVIQAETSLPPEDLLDRLKALEMRLGRQPTFRNGPRVIDLDVLLYDDLMIETGRLVVPHPGLAQRAFVLAPLADLVPDLVPPGMNLPVAELLKGVNISGVKRVMEALPALDRKSVV